MKSKRWITILFIGILGLLIWLLWDKEDSGQFLVELETEYAWTEPDSSMPIIATVIDHNGDTIPDETLENDYKFNWEAKAGIIKGRGSKVNWKASHSPGIFIVEVEVRRITDNLSAKASIEIESKRQGGFRGQFADSGKKQDPADLMPAQKNGSYQIRSVKLDRDKLCDNDTVRVTVDAVDPSGGKEWLFYKVTAPGRNARGADTILRPGRAFLNNVEGRHYDDKHIKVEVFDARTREKVAEKKVALPTGGCETEHGGLLIYCGKSGYGQEYIKCTATTLDDQFTPKRFEWKAGMSGQEMEAVPGTKKFVHIEVGEDRIQNAHSTTFLVHAKAFDEKGEWIEGRTSHFLVNKYWSTKKYGNLLQLIVRHANMPEKMKDSIKLPVRIINPHDEAVLLDVVNETHFACEKIDGKIRTSKTISKEKEWNAISVVDVAEIKPGETISFEITRPNDKNRCLAEFKLSGTGAKSNIPAYAMWPMFSDPSMTERVSKHMSKQISKAIKVLSERRGHEVTKVTAGEIQELIDEGIIEKAEPTSIPYDIVQKIKDGTLRIPPGQEELYQRLMKKAEEDHQKKLKGIDQKTK
jgi:hypothetical protein